MPELYDLVLTGIDAKVADRTASINSIAKFLEIDVVKIEEVVANNHKAIVKRGLQLHDAQQCQKHIFRHGGFCNYRLSSKGGSEFELIPIEEKTEDIVFICPACDYREKLASIEQSPVTCPKCGIIPGKYQKAAEIKAEREMVKKRLQYSQELLEQQAKEMAERAEKAARQKKFEEEIRKELGLPSLLNSRLRIFGSVGLVLILGVGIGVIGVNTLKSDTQPPVRHLPPSGGIDLSKVNVSLSPQQQTLRQLGTSPLLDVSPMETETALMPDAIDQISRGVNNPFLVLQAASILAAGNLAHSVNGQDEQATDSAPLTSLPPLGKGFNSTALSTGVPSSAFQPGKVRAAGSNSTSSVSTQPNPALTNAWRLAAAQSAKFQAKDSSLSPVKAQPTPELNGKELLQELHLDREWGLFLASEAERLARLKQPQKALKGVEAISLEDLKLTTLGRLSGYYLASNDKSDFAKMFDLAMVSINALPDIARQVDGLGQWSANLWRIDEKAKSQQSLEAAIKLVSSINDIAERAKGLASLAMHQAEQGQLKLAQTNFQQANQLISSIDDPATQLRAYVHLAICYAQSGSKDTASSILIKILGNASRVNDETVKADLMREIATAFADIGEVEYALATLEKLDSQQKEKALFNVTRELAYTNRPIDALKGLDKLISAVNRSRAAALLSLMFHYHPGLNALSSSLQEKANESQAQITSLPSQAVVRGEMSRYLAHAGLNREAEEWAVKALESAQKINNAQDRDIAFALLAVNFARAWQFDLASDSVERITDSEIADVATKEITGINQLFSGQ